MREFFFSPVYLIILTCQNTYIPNECFHYVDMCVQTRCPHSLFLFFGLHVKLFVSKFVSRGKLFFSFSLFKNIKLIFFWNGSLCLNFFLKQIFFILHLFNISLIEIAWLKNMHFDRYFKCFFLLRMFNKLKSTQSFEWFVQEKI